jgi:hypothetical protein
MIPEFFLSSSFSFQRAVDVQFCFHIQLKETKGNRDRVIMTVIRYIYFNFYGHILDMTSVLINDRRRQERRW